MIVNPTPEQLVALVNAVRQSRWIRVDALLTAEIEAATERMLDSRDTAVLHEHRGYIKALKNFQSTAREASKTLEKLGINDPL